MICGGNANRVEYESTVGRKKSRGWMEETFQRRQDLLAWQSMDCTGRRLPFCPGRAGPRGILHNTTIHASRCSSFSDFCSRIGVVVFPFEMATWHAWQSMKAAGKGDADELAG